MDLQADVLLVTVTKVESRAVLQTFEEATGQRARILRIADRVYRDLGRVNGAKVCLALSEMGAGGLGAAQQAIQKGIAALRPSAVVMVGIAFGINPAKQAIGDILVSRQLMLYELQRVGATTILPRGDRPHASPSLLNQMQNADIDWDGARVRFGLILTGEKLVDNLDYCQQLQRLEPEALGGEMEGAGLYAACQDAKVDWILVKAICDWADGNKAQDKEVRQELAARNAALFVLHTLTHAPPKSPPPSDIDWTLGDSRPSLPAIKHSVRSSLPHQPYFFGRQKELHAIAEAIAPEARTWGALVDGPGGIGKTALAIRAGHLAPAEQFPHKIFLSGKVRELTPAGEQPLQEFMLPNYQELLKELAHELGEEGLARIAPSERASAVRRALVDKRALLIIDNIETFSEPERMRLYQFLSRLPVSCKAIVTSRRRADIDARAIRLDRLALDEALALLTELALGNRHLQKTTDAERRALYEITHGNPLLIKWVVGQLGRTGSHCRTIEEAYAFLRAASRDNDPLEYIFGDLLDTFTDSEMAVLAALVHFSQPAKLEWVAALAGLALPAALTALEDLDDRALLVSDADAQTFYLPPLAATFLRRKRPEVIAQTAGRLTSRAYALALENGYRKHDRFPLLEAEWPTLAAALPIFVQEDNERLQSVCHALNTFLEFSGRWDELLAFSRQAEEKAVAAGDYEKAGWRAHDVAWVHHLRRQGEEVLAWASRCEAHWQTAGVPVREKAMAIRLRGIGHELEGNYAAARAAYQEALELWRAPATESPDVAVGLSSLADVERLQGENAAAERDYREALRIGKKLAKREIVASALGHLATLALDREDWKGAEELLREVLPLAEAVGRQQLIGAACARLARALCRQGKVAEGLSHARRAVELFTKLRMPQHLETARAVLKECGG